MTSAPLLLAAFLTLASTSGDYALILPTGEQVCAKGLEMCETARRAIELGWWPVLPSGSGIRCEPRPNGCFSHASNCIAGFNCGGAR